MFGGYIYIYILACSRIVGLICVWWIYIYWLVLVLASSKFVGLVNLYILACSCSS